MRKYLKNLLLFVVLCLVISVFFNTLFNLEDYYHGNKNYASKLKDYTESELNFNSVFFGSSRTNSHIDPIQFDSLIQEKVKLTSYNLGVPGGFSPEQYYLFEEFIKTDLSKSIKYAFIELTPLTARQAGNLLKDRVTYWLNIYNMPFILKTLVSERYNFSTKIYRLSSFSVSYVYKLIALKKIRSIVHPTDIQTMAFLRNGFSPLYTEQRKKPMKQKALTKIRNKQIEFDQNPMGIYTNDPHLKKIEELITKAQKSDIELYFIIPPRVDRQEIFGIKKVYNNHIIDVSSYDSFPQLYTVENSYDAGHFNNLGARIYTRILSEKFIEKVYPN